MLGENSQQDQHNGLCENNQPNEKCCQMKIVVWVKIKTFVATMKRPMTTAGKLKMSGWCTMMRTRIFLMTTTMMMMTTTMITVSCFRFFLWLRTIFCCMIFKFTHTDILNESDKKCLIHIFCSQHTLAYWSQMETPIESKQSDGGMKIENGCTLFKKKTKVVDRRRALFASTYGKDFVTFAHIFSWRYYGLAVIEDLIAYEDRNDTEKTRTLMMMMVISTWWFQIISCCQQNMMIML